MNKNNKVKIAYELFENMTKDERIEILAKLQKMVIADRPGQKLTPGQKEAIQKRVEELVGDRDLPDSIFHHRRFHEDILADATL